MLKELDSELKGDQEAKKEIGGGTKQETPTIIEYDNKGNRIR